MPAACRPRHCADFPKICRGFVHGKIPRLSCLQVKQKYIGIQIWNHETEPCSLSTPFFFLFYIRVCLVCFLHLGRIPVCNPQVQVQRHCGKPITIKKRLRAQHGCRRISSQTQRVEVTILAPFQCHVKKPNREKARRWAALRLHVHQLPFEVVCNDQDSQKPCKVSASRQHSSLTSNSSLKSSTQSITTVGRRQDSLNDQSHLVPVIRKQRVSTKYMACRWKGSLAI